MRNVSFFVGWVVAAVVAITLLFRVGVESDVESKSTEAVVTIPDSVRQTDGNANGSSRQPIARQHTISAPDKTPSQADSKTSKAFGWQHPLASIYKAALLAGNPEDRSLAFRMASLCISVVQRSGNKLSLEDLSAMSGITGRDAQALSNASMTSLAKLSAYCESGDANAFLAGLRELKSPRLGIIDRSVNIWQEIDATKRQARIQALTQLLAYPALYPTQFDTWLQSSDFEELLAKYGIRGSYVELVGDDLMRRFGLDEQLIELRDTRRCAILYRCNIASGLPSAEAQKINDVSGAIETLIRQQRWTQIIKG